MSIQYDKPGRVWTVAEAKARLSEILRLSVDEGPQRIGVRKSYVVVPEQVWKDQSTPRKPLGQWLIDNMPHGTNLVIPSDRTSRREIPFADGGAG
ncbi:MAG: prevent-host-death protein [Gemmatimonadota bacterium]|nr:prevent-host-death protein [Gemmatimonadota bacterium]